ncbi:cobalt-precorrin-5B (C(1))-methyltransferase CbiD [Vulcanococcus limneticus]|uniref:cobalt-precorrin-5B (C(1))-methyltransferase CbiD n=1 Tax=Vulcanococcus limneticus TaxID=2170428 RepID=UPI00398BF7AD
MAISGYTLPVWVAAAARAALAQLRGEPFQAEQPLLLEQEGAAGPQLVPVVAAAPLGEGRALAVARCDPGDGLDLTRGLVVWVEASWRTLQPPAGMASPEAPIQRSPDDPAWLELQAGEGVGVHAATRQLCLSAFARRLLEHNLRPLLPAGRVLRLQVIFPVGRRLAERTSNAAFGVVDGLALIGTQALVQRSAAPDQLAAARSELARRVATPEFSGDLVMVIGENGLDLAPQLGLPPALLLKAGNWLGPLLVAAAEQGVRRLLLFGYQGKLIKLAGGIFHTHHHLADGRAEVLTALAALEGLPHAQLRRLHAAATVEAALADLAAADPGAAERLRRRIAAEVEQRSAAYLARYGQQAMAVGAALFNRSRGLAALGPLGSELWGAFSAETAFRAEI